MNAQQMSELTSRFLDAWNSQDVERVLDCYTDDLVYRDPNTRGVVHGRESMRRYLTKLFAGWKMHWETREAHVFEGGNGCSFSWRASFERPSGGNPITIDGIDLVEVRDDRLSRNEVYFDRAPLAPLL